jgi:DNA-binding HxlR family transcriptional regulator
MSSRRMLRGSACDPVWCPIEVTLEVIGGVWKVVIVRELLEGTRRYGELHRRLRGVTHKMLTQQLRELERDGLLVRKVYPQVPPKVEYSLTRLGRSLSPLLGAMQKWGTAVLAARPHRPAPAAKGRIAVAV